jgi:hypothetical protein
LLQPELLAQQRTAWRLPSNSTAWFLVITLADLSLVSAPLNSHPLLAKIDYLPLPVPHLTHFVMQLVKARSYIGAKAINESVLQLLKDYLDFVIRFQPEQCYLCKQGLVHKYFLPGKMLTNCIEP